ncbi:MAG: hypothetical protein Q7J65_02730 [Candidatus Marinimicrobia bacterium]|nr:hypothetical protein [Candidatus Neomarinimicrobiota bacterium]
MEDLVCPECGVALNEADLRETLVCKSCKTKLRDPKYIDFLELLVYNDVVDDIDFFDMSLYGDEILKDEREDYDEPDIDPAKFEKRKEVWDEFEDDIELKEGLKDDSDIEDEAWNIFDDEALEEDEVDDDLDVDLDND